MADFTKYANFAKGTFYLSATLFMGSFSYIAYTQWQDYWSSGFEDFRSISAAIVELEKTTRPLSEIAPHVYTQVDEMNRTIAQMQISVQNMDRAVNGINGSVYAMSYTVPHQMTAIRDGMHPWNLINPFK